jgi:hypothetical protein
MRALVLTLGRPAARSHGWERAGDPLLWLADRPFAQHVCEALVRFGVRVVDWVSGPDAAELRRFVAAGDRWGLAVTHHPAADRPAAYHRVREVAGGYPPGEPVLLAHGDRLVRLPEAGEPRPAECLFGSRDDEYPHAEWTWSGWGVLTRDTLAGIPPAAAGESDLAGYLRGRAAAAVTDLPLDVLTPAGYLAANHWALLAASGRPTDPPGGAEARVSRRATVHPTAVLVPPVSIAAGVHVAAHATVGPFAAVAAGCVIDRRAAVSDAVVLPDTYVGERVRLARAIVDGRGVVRVGPDGSARSDPRVPVASLAGHPFAGLGPAVGRAARFVRAAVRLGRPTVPR